VKKNTTIAIASLVLLAAAAVATADVTATYVTNSSVWGRLGGDGMAGMNNYYVGVSQFLKADGSTFYGFCVDLEQDAFPGTYTWGEDALTGAPVASKYTMNATQAGMLSELWGRHYADVLNANGTFNDHNAASFQAAVWEIIYQTSGPYNVSSGWDTTAHVGFQVASPSGNWTNVDAARANAWIGELDGTGPMADVSALVSTTTQDFMVLAPKTGAVPVVPAPAGIVLVLAGVGLVGWAKRYLSR
jgi:hypothetical protein